MRDAPKNLGRNPQKFLAGNLDAADNCILNLSEAPSTPRNVIQATHLSAALKIRMLSFE